MSSVPLRTVIYFIIFAINKIFFYYNIYLYPAAAAIYFVLFIYLILIFRKKSESFRIFFQE